MALMEHSPQFALPQEESTFITFDNQEFVDNQNFEIEACKRKLYDLVCAEADGIPVDMQEKELAKQDLLSMIICQAQVVFESNVEQMTELEALGSAGQFIEAQTSSLTDAIVSLYDTQVPSGIQHRPIDTIITERFADLQVVYRTEPERLDPRVIIKDACFNGLLYAQREVNAALSTTEPVEHSCPTPEEEICAPEPVSRNVGRLALLRRLGL